VTLQIILVFTLTHPKTFTRPNILHLHLSCCSVYIYIFYNYTRPVLYLSNAFTPYIQLLTLTHTTLVKMIGFGFDHSRVRSVSTLKKLINFFIKNHFFFILRLLSFSQSTMIFSYE
jgi:hypothetical protein